MTTREKIKPADKFAVSPAEAAEIISVNKSTFYRRVMPFVFSGEIASLMIGKCRRIVVRSLLAWYERQAEREAA